MSDDSGSVYTDLFEMGFEDRASGRPPSKLDPLGAPFRDAYLMGYRSPAAIEAQGKAAHLDTENGR